jgi:hypothetical protein
MLTIQDRARRSDRGGIGKAVVIDNDCNMALIAEIAVGAARGRENVAMLTIGTGIGGRSSKRARSFVARCQLDSSVM